MLFYFFSPLEVEIDAVIEEVRKYTVISLHAVNVK